MKSKTLPLASLALVAALSLAAAPTLFAQATLVPGASVSPVPSVPITTPIAVATYVMTFTNANENGTVTEDVFSSDGTLDFYYSVVNNATSSDSLSRLTVGNFTGFTTAVGYLDSGLDAPSEATRQSNGDSVGFDFADPIAPGTATDSVEVITNATALNDLGTITILDSQGVNINGNPSPAVPEPSTGALILGGFGILCLLTIGRNRSSL